MRLSLLVLILCIPAVHAIGVSPSQLTCSGKQGEQMELSFWLFSDKSEVLITLEHHPKWLSERLHLPEREWSRVELSFVPTSSGTTQDMLIISNPGGQLHTGAGIPVEIEAAAKPKLTVGLGLCLSIVALGVSGFLATKKFKS